MARDFYTQRFGGAGTGGLRSVALICVLVLAGCASSQPTQTVGPWGYEFSLGHFVDQRPDDDAKMMSVIPFSIDSFMLGWRNNVGRSVFANQQAKLDITLKDFEATTSGKSFSISMDVMLKGRDAYGRSLGTMNGSCSGVVQVDGDAWGDFWQQARAQGTVKPLTPKGREATMWQKVMDACTKDLASQFGTVLAGGVR